MKDGDNSIQERRIELAEKKSRDELSIEETEEFNSLQQTFFDDMELKFPHPPSIQDKLNEIERRLS